jgi:hypothetical protein
MRLAWPCIVIAIAGCGSVDDGGVAVDGDGTTSESGDDTALSDTAGDVGRDAPPIAPAYSAPGGCKTSCPPIAPKGAMPCGVSNLECEYGDSFDPRCNTVARCVSGAWKIIDPSGLCPAPNPATDQCPSSPFGPERGHVCPVEGAICAYSDGVCDCQRASGSDAGGTEPVWACATFTCKGPRARLGCNCTGALACQHGGCTGEIVHGVDVACSGGFYRRPDSCK